MEKTKLNLKLFLSPFICVLLLFLIDISLVYYPLFFSLIISLSNYKSHQLHLIISIIVGIIFTYLSWLVVLLGWGLFAKFEATSSLGITNEAIIGNWSYSYISFCITGFVIGPLILLNLHKSLFKDTKTKLTKWIIIIAIGILVLVSFVQIDTSSSNFFNIFNLWQLIMTFVLQLIINQKNLMKIYFKNKASSQHNV